LSGERLRRLEHAPQVERAAAALRGGRGGARLGPPGCLWGRALGAPEVARIALLELAHLGRGPPALVRIARLLEVDARHVGPAGAGVEPCAQLVCKRLFVQEAA